MVLGLGFGVGVALTCTAFSRERRKSESVSLKEMRPPAAGSPFLRGGISRCICLIHLLACI